MMVFHGLEVLIILGMVVLSLGILWAKYRPKAPKDGCSTGVCGACQGCDIGRKV
jgi:hypothetical protein